MDKSSPNFNKNVSPNHSPPSSPCDSGKSETEYDKTVAKAHPPVQRRDSGYQASTEVTQRPGAKIGSGSPNSTTHENSEHSTDSVKEKKRASGGSHRASSLTESEELVKQKPAVTQSPDAAADAQTPGAEIGGENISPPISTEGSRSSSGSSDSPNSTTHYSSVYSQDQEQGQEAGIGLDNDKLDLVFHFCAFNVILYSCKKWSSRHQSIAIN